MGGFELFRKIRKITGTAEIADVWNISTSLADRWCLPSELETDTGAKNPIDKMRYMLDVLRKDGQHAIALEIQDFLFPCGKLIVCGEPSTVILEFTTASQESFVSFIDAIADGKVTAEERKQILDSVGEVEIAIEKIKAVLK